MESVHEVAFLESEATTEDLSKAEELAPIITNTRQAIIAQSRQFDPPRTENDYRFG